ncbi:MAG: hypothetical protein ACK559_35685 [bacterium]
MRQSSPANRPSHPPRPRTAESAQAARRSIHRPVSRPELAHARAVVLVRGSARPRATRPRRAPSQLGGSGARCSSAATIAATPPVASSESTGAASGGSTPPIDHTRSSRSTHKKLL